MIQSLLIANRGEIACRIIRTARKMGIRTIAVYSDADARALHVRQADEAVHIGPSPARDSYLVGDKIVAAARVTGAEAIHPGYGFLSENAEFAQAVIDAGLVWVGPRPASITAMGLKDAAKTLMAAAGVPVTPGYMGENQEPAFLADQAAEIGYPVLIKAVAGGGGKGMRKVEAAADFADALASCQREAMASFGNAHVLIEKYIQRPRHIEVQIFGDTHGNIVHLFERDCSLQRRHQKVIEEAPAPGMDAATRDQLCAAAVRAAKAVDYVGAGTIEFIADASDGLRADRIWFMEMNTRLQVEHPVTEEITGIDLVEWQLRVASGEPLPMRQDELSITGHAIEVRLCAEEPRNHFLPATGTVDILSLGYLTLREDLGIAAGDAITPFYDPMIGKVIGWGRDRDMAIEQLTGALEDAIVYPVATNIGLLVRALRHPAFVAGDVDTGFIDRHLTDILPGALPHPEALTHAGEAMVAESMSLENRGALRPMLGFRMNAAPQHRFWGQCDGQPFTALLDAEDNTTYHADLCKLSATDVIVSDQGQTSLVTLAYRRVGTDGAHDGDILSPMPGRVIAVDVAEGQTVTKGQKLLTLEAMKMEHSLTAPFDGMVAALNAAPGAQVQVEALLVRIEAATE